MKILTTVAQIVMSWPHTASTSQYDTYSSWKDNKIIECLLFAFVGNSRGLEPDLKKWISTPENRQRVYISSRLE